MRRNKLTVWRGAMVCERCYDALPRRSFQCLCPASVYLDFDRSASKYRSASNYVEDAEEIEVEIEGADWTNGYPGPLDAGGEEPHYESAVAFVDGKPFALTPDEEADARDIINRNLL